MTYSQPIEYKAPPRRVPLKWVAVGVLVAVFAVLFIVAPGVIIGSFAWIGNGFFGILSWLGTFGFWFGGLFGFGICTIVAVVISKRKYFFKQTVKTYLPQTQQYTPQSGLSTELPVPQQVQQQIMQPVVAPVLPVAPPVEQEKKAAS